MRCQFVCLLRLGGGCSSNGESRREDEEREEVVGGVHAWMDLFFPPAAL